MTPVVIVVVIVVVVAIGVWAYSRRGGAASGATAEPKSIFRPSAPYREFHVQGETAAVYFDVPLPEGDVDPVLSDLLMKEAVEVLREKKSHHLPLEQVTEVKAYGTRGGRDVVVGSIPLETPGALPEIDHVEIVPHFSSVPFDPLTHLGEKEHTVPRGGAADITGTPEAAALRPLSEELSLTGRIEAGLRAQGIDPATMSAGDLALGLMKLSGYTIQDGTKPNTYLVATPGQRTFLHIVDHEESGYPELDESQIKEFQIGFASAGADRGLLVTEKFGPYLIYDAERRNPKTKFITRERLQDFVDSFSMS